MKDMCVLVTNGYQATFRLENKTASEEYVNVKISFLLDHHLGAVSVDSDITFIAIKDLERLAAYLEDHVARLRQAQDNESHVFLTYELDFQMQALGGKLDSDGVGDFMLLFLVRVGPTPSLPPERAYVGGMATVSVEKAKEFAVCLRKTLKDLERERGDGREVRL
jgi:hypothetical protein